jgi:hypothetical protein
MADLVCIPTYFRPASLYLCLEHLLKAYGGEDKEICVFHDRHWGDPGNKKNELTESLQVFKSFVGKFSNMRYVERPMQRSAGNARNFLEMYREVLKTRFRYVYTVEDDVIVAPDFFRWHEAVQARGDYFCSVAWHCIRNKAVDKTNDPTAYIESGVDFSSIGVCWKRENLAIVAEHATDAYYRDQPGYLHARFPTAPEELALFSEQAGLIMRILLSNPTLKVAWAGLPRSAHTGVSGYHRLSGKTLSGSVESQISQLRSKIGNTESLLAMCDDPFEDISALPEIGEWKAEDLHVTQKF